VSAQTIDLTSRARLREHGPSMPARVTSDAFIGRRDQLAALERALAAASASRAMAGLVFVAGESGVGKSRLTDHFADRAAAGGARVLWGDCIDLGDSELPYAPIVSALRSLVREGHPVFGALGPARAELARLLPELGAPGDLLVEPYVGSAQGRLFELLLVLFERLAEESPVLLVIEDLHWADRSTRDFLSFLARNVCRRQLLVVATFRTDELHRRHPLRPFLAEIERTDQASRIAIERFSREELGAQLAAILGAIPDDELLERVYARSEGNPLFAEEILAAEREGDGTLPESLRDALILRVEALGETAQEALRWVSAAQRVEQDVLQEASELEPRALRDALRDAIAHHVLVTQPGDGHLAFRHALLREAVHDDLLPGERSGMHRRLATVLEARVAAEPCVSLERATEIAHHFDAAGDQPAALRTAVRAAQTAERAHAEQEAAALYERALELWDRVADPEALAGCDHVELLARTAGAHLLEHHRCIVLIKRALHELDQEAEPARSALLLERLGRARWAQGKGQIAVEAWDAALALLPAQPPSVERAKLLAAKAAGLMLWGRYADARAMAAEALAIADAVGSRAVRIDALNTMGVCVRGGDDTAADLGLLREALALAREDGDVDQLARGYANLADVLHRTGDTDAARTVLIEGRRELHALGSPASCLVLQQAEIATDLGLWDEAEALVPPELGPGMQGTTRVFFELTRAGLSMSYGDHAEARRRLEVASDLVARSYEPQWHAPLTALLAGLERRERDIDAARAAIRIGLERLVDTDATDDGARLARIYCAAAGVEADAALQARDLGRPDDEAAAVAAARGWAARTREAAARPFAIAMPEGAALVLAADAEAAAATGTPDPELWARAADTWAAMSRPVRVARARWREAEARLTLGDRAGAEAVGRDALAAARRLRSRWLIEELTALARRGRLRLEDTASPVIAVAASADDPIAGLGLTPRERDVLALVARGATNRAIGEQLFMAEKTASVHVSRILAKLDVRSRTEAAAVAHRLGLEAAAA
jgi:DNA-binding CsgD family transcriptional regulator/tetratricopeptide (TPR) repeat protein